MQNSEKDDALPLSGIRVIELGTLIAGPYASSLLAQFGAEVIKVETPKVGDPLRSWRLLHKGTSLWWYSQSRNKKSITLNLKSDEGQKIARDLIKDADIVIENFKPGTLEKFGLGWEEMSKLNPKLIMVRVSGYGQTGPYSKRAGFAAISESMGGLRYITGYPGMAPVRVGVSLGDTLAALYGVIGGMMALFHVRANNGKGQYVDVALYEATFAIMESLIPEYAMFKEIRERSGASLPGISPTNTYQCKDGQYVIIAGNSDAIFDRLMKAIGRTDLAEDPSLSTNVGRVARNEFLDQVIGDWTLKHDIEYVLEILEEADVPSGKVYTAEDIYKDVQYRSREMIEKHKLFDGTDIEIPGIVPKLSDTPGKTKKLGPSLGEDTSEILQGMGYTKSEIKLLEKNGVI